MRPWNELPIEEIGEPLLPLPAELLRLDPHPYASLGAPYGAGAGPWQLRRGVIERLLEAQRLLRQEQPQQRLAIFDAWRPVAVQRFMVQHSLRQECARRGIDPHQAGPERKAVVALVGRFWASPSEDPALAPPHSTGAAVDLTLATAEGQPLDMGGAIDALGPISEPDHHAEAARLDPLGPAAVWQRRRERLARVMASAGFARHPNEWWHFSHGDQLWAWRQGQPAACYGRVAGASAAPPPSPSSAAS